MRSPQAKPQLRDFSCPELVRLLDELRQPAFRARQIFAWLHKKPVEDFQSMTDLPEELRQKLSREYSLDSLKNIKTVEAEDTKKFLWQMADGEKVESVLLDDSGRRTICLSCQVGCKLGCLFCATGQVYFRRQLSPAEIIGQVQAIEKQTGPVANLVFMGMGEPLDNFDNVLKSIEILNHPLGRNFGLRRITISTCGLTPQINKLARLRLPIKLAVSLNAASDKLRRQIMPWSKKYPLSGLRQAVANYIEMSGRRATFEYVLIDGLNDNPASARELVDFTRRLKVNVNLIAFNPFRGCPFRPPKPETINKFRRILEIAGVKVTQRFIRGRTIAAACGQLTAGYLGSRNQAGKNEIRKQLKNNKRKRKYL